MAIEQRVALRIGEASFFEREAKKTRRNRKSYSGTAVVELSPNAQHVNGFKGEGTLHFLSGDTMSFTLNEFTWEGVDTAAIDTGFPLIGLRRTFRQVA